MSKKLIATTTLVFALATGASPMALGAPNNATPASPGACNMLHTSARGLEGMMNDRHVFDIMIPLVEASLHTGCSP
jgi:hypothetical protein